MFGAKKNDGGTFASPDFAFPAQVSKRAAAEYESALKTSDAGKAITAAIQLAMADGQVKDTAYSESIARFEKIASEFPSPWREAALLLEARLYKELYEADSWDYNRRILPEGEDAPKDPKDWNTLLFQNRIFGLVKDATSDASLDSRKLEEISPILVDWKEASEGGVSIGDFYATEGAGLLSGFSDTSQTAVIPFGGSGEKESISYRCDKMSSQLLDDVFNRLYSAGNYKYAMVAALNILRGPAGYGYRAGRDSEKLKKMISLFEKTSWCGPFLLMDDQRNDEGNRDDAPYYLRIKNYLDAYPGCYNSEELRNCLYRMLAPKVSFQLPDRILPGREREVTAKVKNLTEGWVRIFKVEDDADRVELPITQPAVAVVEIKSEDLPAKEQSIRFTLPALKEGRYTAVAYSDKAGKHRVGSDRWCYGFFDVSELDLVSLPSRGDHTRYYVVSGADMRPIPLAEVKVYDRKKGKKTLVNSLTTDKDGSFLLASGSKELVITKGASRLRKDIYVSNGWYNDNRESQAQILPDLSLYHPGDTVAFVAVVSYSEGPTCSPYTDTPVSVSLNDVNGKEVGVAEGVTDRFGRFSGRIPIPADGLLGNYSLSLDLGYADGKASFSANRIRKRGLGYVSVSVEEYKRPTFRVLLSNTGTSYTVGELLTFKGSAETYTGMPVGGADVEYKVSSVPYGWWWRGSRDGASYGGKVRTDAAGEFAIELDTAPLAGTEYERGVYSLSVKVTDPAGESHESSRVLFALGNAYAISLPFGARDMNITGKDTIRMDVKVVDMMAAPVKKEVRYEVKGEDGSTVADGTFESPGFSLPARLFASGKYTFRYELAEDSTVKADCTVVFYRDSDSRPPVETSLWLPETERVVSPGEKSVAIRVGNSYPDHYLLMNVCNQDTLLRTEWVKVSDGFVTVDVKAPEMKERVYVDFAGMHDFKSKECTVTLTPAQQLEEVGIKADCFRDHTVPGAEERWTFKVTCGEKVLGSAPVMAVMTDAALDAIRPFRWSLNPWGAISWSAASSISIPGVGSHYYSFEGDYRHIYSGEKAPLTPSFNTYGQPLGGWVHRHILYECALPTAAAGRSSRRMLLNAKSEETFADDDSDGMVMEDFEAEMSDSYNAVASMKMAEGGASMDESAVEGSMAAENLPEVRESECPVAFFMPDLITDEEGVVTLGFTLPSTVGSWKLQLAALSPEMKGGVASFETVAAKNVMARLNQPRFLRVGDKADLSALLYNNSDSAIDIAGRIEVVDALTGRIIEARDFSGEKVVPSASRNVVMELNVGGETSGLIIKAYALSENGSDGEQYYVPVLPSSTSVTEGIPFFLAPGESEYLHRLPKYSSNANLTLTYCNNPVWECVTMLPSLLVPQSVNVLELISALYGNVVADDLFRKYPKLVEGIKVLSEAGELRSPLEKNRDLKIMALENTPWVNNAEAETLRMSSLVEYADTAKSTKAVNKLAQKLVALQQADGGWSWCPDMESSPYITGRALLYISMMRQMGCLPSPLVGVAERAVRYVDREEEKEWVRNKRKWFSMSHAVNFFYIRSGFSEVGMSVEMESMKAKMLKKLAADWRDLGIYDKSVGAIVAWRYGKKELAREILRSVAEFASVTPERGMWFDRLNDRFFSFNPLITTAQALEAFAEITPDGKEVDLLRQSLLVSSRTEAWGDRRESCEVIHAILSTGSDWTGDAPAPEITLDGKRVGLPASAPLTGAFTLNLPASSAGAELRVSKQGAAPSWGGVVAQYEAPIKEVKAQGSELLKVEKEIYSVASTADGVKATKGDLKVGDRVRVTLSLVCDRPLEYVAVCDSRSAALEPADALSGYTSTDGVWYYLETRNSGTNLFIPYLPKGRHLISYECFVDRTGDYSLGIAEGQSQLDPSVAAHSGGVIVTVSGARE